MRTEPNHDRTSRNVLRRLNKLAADLRDSSHGITDPELLFNIADHVDDLAALVEVCYGSESSVLPEPLGFPTAAVAKLLGVAERTMRDRCLRLQIVPTKPQTRRIIRPTVVRRMLEDATDSESA